MKSIPLTQGLFAQVDDEDFDYLSQFKWCAKRGRKTWYAVTGSPKHAYMHRMLINSPKVDHEDGCGLNNRRRNLRECSGSQNLQNRGATIKNKSGFKGVSWATREQQWRAAIKIPKKQIHLGYFLFAEDAAKAYNIAAKIHFRKFAQLNKL